MPARRIALRRALVVGALAAGAAGLCGGTPAVAPARAQAIPAQQGRPPADATGEAIRRYREMLDDANPAEFDEARGASLWREPRGPKHASMEACDLGLGPGVVRGAYARLPRWFTDTGRVQDLESRLVTCITRLQGIPEAEVVARPFSTDAERSAIEALVAYVVGQSRGARIAVAMDHPAERLAYALGERLFYYRAGPYDFSCASCHSEEGRRIRLQDLPQLSTPEGARRAYSTWPAYRVSQGLFRSFQWRLNDCFRQQRFPEPAYGSDATIALTLFIAANANGSVYQGPGIKR